MMAILKCDCAEPLYGTLCLYHRDKREKLSEDFHFRCLPSEFQDVSPLNNECCNFQHVESFFAGKEYLALDVKY